MKNEWLNDLYNKMEDHKEDVSGELWDDIREELFGEKDQDNIVTGISKNGLEIKKKNISKTNYKKLLYRISGVAAAIAIFFIADRLPDFISKKEPRYYVNQDTVKSTQANPHHQKVSIEKNKTIAESPFKQRGSLNLIDISPALGENILNRTNYIEYGTGISKIFKNNRERPGVILSNHNIAEINMTYLESQMIYRGKVDPGFILTEEKEQKEDTMEPGKEMLAKNKSKKLRMMSLLTGNASLSSTEQFPGYATLNGTPMSLPENVGVSGYQENPMVAILLANQDKKVNAKIRHKTPVTFGASLYHELGNRWGIGTGINYTRLSSDLTSGSSSDFLKSQQNLYYVGVPVQVNYSVIRKGAFTGYIAGGGVVEKMISGNVKTKFIVDGELKEETGKNIKEKPIQVSLNGAVGLQLKVIKNIGIYAEPGVGYHFNDNSSLNTIYKEKPLNFNLRFGVRLLLD